MGYPARYKKESGHRFIEETELNGWVENIDWSAFIPIVLAMALGGIIGLEREIHHKPAGLRTIILISTGAVLFTVIAENLADINAAMRVVQGVITGVGFIGAGAIMRDRVSVHGVTTAATIWLTTGIGIACGMRMYEIAIGVTFLALITLWGLSPLDRKISKPHHDRRATDHPESDGL